MSVPSANVLYDIDVILFTRHISMLEAVELFVEVTIKCFMNNPYN
jgi:hypothetical protein